MTPRRSGLGRGLDALLPSGESHELEVTSSGLEEVAVEAIAPNPRQPRRHFDEDALADLARSMRELGILQPLLVRALGGGRYELVAGERRLRAAKAAGIGRVPVMTVETDDRGSLERALVENLHREDLNPIEEAQGYRQLIEEAGLTQEALGHRLGRSRVTITNALRLLDLPQPIQRLLVEGRLTAGHGRALLSLQSSPFQQRLAVRVTQEGLSVRETQELAARYESMTVTSSGGSGASSDGPQGRRERPAVATEAQRRLADYLQTRVRVDVGKRKGKIVVDFISLEELGRILALITRTTVGTGPQLPRD